MSGISAFTHYTPTRVEFGRGVVGQKLIDEVKEFGSKSVFIVTDKGILNSELLKPIDGQLEENNLKYKVYSDVKPDPTDMQVEEVAKIAKDLDVDTIIAIGGGSTMDLSKAVGLLLTNGGKIGEYYFPLDNVKKPSVPVIAIPTTAGTGSEISLYCVITDTRKDTAVKEAVASYLIAPQVALVDPLMTVSLPPRQTAATGMDALSHAIEAYTTTLAQPISDAMALKAITMIVNNLPKAVYNGEDIDARDNMILGSTMALMAVCNSLCHAPHCLGESLGALKHHPHGITVAVFLPYVMDYLMMGSPERFRDIAVAMGENVEGLTVREAARKSIDAVLSISKSIGMPSLKELNVVQKDFEKIAEMSNNNGVNCHMHRQLGVEDYRIIIENTYNETFNY